MLKNYVGLGMQTLATDSWYMGVQIPDNTLPVQKIVISDLAALLGGGGGGSQSWDDTLAIDAVTARNPVYDVNSLNKYIDFVNPVDYGVDPGASNFSRWIDANFVNPSSGRRDVVFGWMCYNSTNQGGQADPTEAAAWYKIETYYEQSGSRMEFHMPEIQSTDGTNARLMSIYANRDDGTSFFNYNTYSINWFSKTDVNNDWASLGTGPVGTVELFLNASLGTGGLLGDQTNYCRIILADGTGNGTVIFTTGGEVAIISQSALTVQNEVRIDMPSYVRYNHGPGANDVLFESVNDADNHGYLFYGAGQLTAYFFMYKNFNYSVTPMVCADYLDIASSNATYGHILFPNAITDPVDTTLQKIWADGTDFFTYQTAVKKKFVLGDSGSFTPTITGLTNFSTSSAPTMHWQRNGDIVFFWGTVNITSTAAGACTFSIDTPVPSALSGGSADAKGVTMGGAGVSPQLSTIFALAANSIFMSITTTVTSSVGVAFNGSFIVN